MDSDANKDFPKSFNIGEEEFTFEKILGEGAFGYGLLYKSAIKQVAVKILKPNSKQSLNKESYLLSRFNLL
jgi:predicted Ser/Thr protein kinase